ncbi:MAG: glycosyltransferase family 39 protein [Ignavibacteriae bacterium]|nr:glycosyltransferase family 39 protein [Ignavibacteriota bacterium]
MSKYLLIFLISIIYGFSVLLFRNYYEKKTGELKSHWNITQLEEGDAKNFFDRGLALSQGKPYHGGLETVPIIAYARTPVYSFFLALTFIIFGVSFKAVIVLQIIIASLIACLISFITKMIFNNIVSWISGFLAILYYPMWNDAMLINCELLSMLIGLISLYYILKFYYSQNIDLKYLFLSGVYAGLAALTRGQFLYYSLIYVIFIFSISGISRGIKMKLTLYGLIFSLIPILIWSVYAYASSGIFVFITTHGTLQLWWGWSPGVVIGQHYPMWNPLWDNDVSLLQEDLHTAYLPVKSSFWFIKEGLKFIYTYPYDSLKIAYFKLLDSWGLMDIYFNHGVFIKIFKVLKFNWNFLLVIPAWIILWKNKENKVFYYYSVSACILYTFISLMTAGVIRYRLPYLDPLFIILASYTLYKLYSHFYSKKLNSN